MITTNRAMETMVAFAAIGTDGATAEEARVDVRSNDALVMGGVIVLALIVLIGLDIAWRRWRANQTFEQ